MKVGIEVLLDSSANQSQVGDCKPKCLQGPGRKCEGAKRTLYEKTRSARVKGAASARCWPVGLWPAFPRPWDLERDILEVFIFF